jgi:AcrR family transcriptional regulator
MSTATLTARERRALNTRQAILDAARELISERGPYGLSLREVARRSDYSPAGLYEYFESKDDLIAAVLEEGFERFAGYLLAVPQDLSPQDYLLELGNAYLRFAHENPQHFMLIFNSPNACDNPDLDTLVSNSTLSTLVNAVHNSVTAGDFPPDVPEQELVLAAWSLVHGMATLQLTQLAKVDYDWETASENALRTWYEGLRALTRS